MGCPHSFVHATPVPGPCRYCGKSLSDALKEQEYQLTAGPTCAHSFNPVTLCCWFCGKSKPELVAAAPNPHEQPRAQLQPLPPGPIELTNRKMERAVELHYSPYASPLPPGPAELPLPPGIERRQEEWQLVIREGERTAAIRTIAGTGGLNDELVALFMADRWHKEAMRLDAEAERITNLQLDAEHNENQWLRQIDWHAQRHRSKQDKEPRP